MSLLSSMGTAGAKPRSRSMRDGRLWAVKSLAIVSCTTEMADGGSRLFLSFFFFFWEVLGGRGGGAGVIFEIQCRCSRYMLAFKGNFQTSFAIYRYSWRIRLRPMLDSCSYFFKG